MWVLIFYSSLSLNPFYGYEPVSIEFANAMFQAGDYKQALVEYKRFLHYKPDDPRRPYLMFRIGVCYSRLGRYKKAEEIFRDVMIGGVEELRERAEIALARVFFLREEYGPAKLMTRFLMEKARSRAIAAEAAYLRGWCFLNERNWFEAALTFRRASEIGEGTELGLEALKLAEGCLKALKLPKKSPARAKRLSALIPGMGQLIAGDIKGIFWLVGEFALSCLTADSVRRGRYFDAALFGIALGWIHLINIRNAERSVLKFNLDLETRFLKKLKADHSLP